MKNGVELAVWLLVFSWYFVVKASIKLLLQKNVSECKLSCLNKRRPMSLERNLNPVCCAEQRVCVCLTNCFLSAVIFA